MTKLRYWYVVRQLPNPGPYLRNLFMFCLAVVFFFVKIVFVSVLYKVYFQKAKNWTANNCSGFGDIVSLKSVFVKLHGRFEWSAEFQVILVAGFPSSKSPFSFKCSYFKLG